MITTLILGAAVMLSNDQTNAKVGLVVYKDQHNDCGRHGGRRPKLDVAGDT